ncbi:MAG TPA: ABC transporter permease, partial [Stellaceae bacterium]|nr:ABC transporter permease [Stellaceae bacterium]
MSGTLIARKTPARTRLSHPALVLPLLAYLAVFYAYPVAAMMLKSVTEPSWTLENFRRAFSDPVYLHVLWLTLRVGLIVTVAALLLGFPVAYVLARIDRAKSNLLMILVLLPFWTSILVRTYAWMVLLGRQGLINQFLLGIGAIEEPVQLLNTTFAVYVAMVHILLPFMILP